MVDAFSFEKPSAKQAAEILRSLGIAGRVTVVVPDDDVNAILSFRNLAKARVDRGFRGQHVRPGQ